MSEIITEALLEMHYHRAIIECFRSVYGWDFVRLLKPSPQQEAWVGFDQGWVKTTVSTATRLRELRQAIADEARSTPSLFLGYFLQFKLVERHRRRSKYCPRGYTIPYHRVELSLKPNKITSLSQHETLLRLNTIRNAAVYYVCPMRFSLDELYDDPSVDHLQCVDLNSAPSGWATNDRHFIMFQSEDELNPMWCSEPLPARMFKLRDWIQNPDSGPPKLHATQLYALVQDSVAAIRESAGPLSRREDPARLLPECFTIIEFGREIGQG